MSNFCGTNLPQNNKQRLQCNGKMTTNTWFTTTTWSQVHKHRPKRTYYMFSGNSGSMPPKKQNTNFLDQELVFLGGRVFQVDHESSTYTCDQVFVYHKFDSILVELTSPWTCYQRIHNWCDKVEQVQHHLNIYWYGISVNNMSICLNVTWTRLIRMPMCNIDTIEHANQCTSNIPMRPRCLVAE